MTSTEDCFRLLLSNSKASIFFVALDSLRSELDRYFAILRSLVSQIDSLDIDFTTLATQVQESHTTLCRDADLLLEEFCALVDENDVLEDAPEPPSTDQFLVVYNKLRS